MLTCEIYPFQAGMATGADAVLVSHMTAPNAVQDGLPASLSREMITEKLRGELRFQRVILTDSLSAQAITDTYSAGQAALLAFQAGADLLLMPEDLPEALRRPPLRRGEGDHFPGTAGSKCSADFAAEGKI